LNRRVMKSSFATCDFAVDEPIEFRLGQQSMAYTTQPARWRMVFAPRRKQTTVIATALESPTILSIRRDHRQLKRSRGQNDSARIR
jgi:hypothetical protein